MCIFTQGGNFFMYDFDAIFEKLSSKRKKQEQLTKTVGCGTIIFNILVAIIKILARLCAGAVVLFALAHFVPELREELPSLYLIVDKLMIFLESCASKASSILGLS